MNENWFETDKLCQTGHKKKEKQPEEEKTTEVPWVKQFKHGIIFDGTRHFSTVTQYDE